MTHDHYILEPDGTIRSGVELIEWARWLETAKRHVGHDHLPGGVLVSTVFFGIDHNFGPDGPPLLFETMIFGGEHDQFQDRYATLDEAKAGHAKAVELARAGTIA